LHTSLPLSPCSFSGKGKKSQKGGPPEGGGGGKKGGGKNRAAYGFRPPYLVRELGQKEGKKKYRSYMILLKGEKEKRGEEGRGGLPSPSSSLP